MARTETFVAPGVRLEWQYDRWNGWRINAWKPNVSMTFTDRKALLKFISWPTKTPTGDLIRGWIDGQIAGVSAQAAEQDGTAPAEATLSAELLATGFGPEVFAGELDPSDPNYQTRTVL